MAKTFDNLMPRASVPLGGLGTGNLTLHASGELTEFEIFNRPSKGLKLPYSFFALYAAFGDQRDARVLEAHQAPDYDKGRGYHPLHVRGLPRFSSSRMSYAFPFARIQFEEQALPLEVSLEAFSPFIPLNPDDSGIPAVVMRYSVRNVGKSPAEVMIAGSMPNIHGFRGFDCFDNYLPSANLTNERVDGKGFSGVTMTGAAVPEDALNYANNAVLALDADARVRPFWYRGGWYDSVTDFWSHFTKGVLSPEAENLVNSGPVGPQGYLVGSAGINKTIAPGECQEFTFVLSWYVPNRIKGWGLNDNPGQSMKNYYASRFEDALCAGRYLIDNLQRLEEDTRLFSNALQSSTLPEDVIDSVSGNLTVLISNTCFRDADGGFFAWEGSHENEGSCEGTCTHVWNYTHSLAFLFPQMERSARLNEFLSETEPDGKMNFRTRKHFGLSAHNMYAAIDGQLGCIVRAWREYTLSGDADFLKAIYPQALLSIEYARREWDKDGDGLLEALQHNTYDIEFVGVNPLSGVMYLAALRALQEMARAMGDEPRAQAFGEDFSASSAKLDALCFEGEYYIQSIEDVNVRPYQFGLGCLSDQLLGQTNAHVSGLGALLPEDHLKSAAKSIYQYNFLAGDQRPACLQRLYVHHDEPGLVMCTWPNGGRPRFPFVYSDEVWTGTEYQVATLLCYEGMIDEAMEIVKAVRARYDGVRREPYNEMECGFHYARSLSSYGLLVALCGLTVQPNGEIDFQPRVNADDFHCFYCDGRHFGMLHHDATGKRVEVLR